VSSATTAAAAGLKPAKAPTSARAKADCSGSGSTGSSPLALPLVRAEIGAAASACSTVTTPHGQEVAHNADGVGDAAVAGSPPPDVPRGDVEQSGGAALGDAERVERRAEFGRGY